MLACGVMGIFLMPILAGATSCGPQPPPEGGCNECGPHTNAWALDYCPSQTNSSGVSPSSFCNNSGDAPTVPTVTPPIYQDGQKETHTSYDCTNTTYQYADISYTVGVVKWNPDTANWPKALTSTFTATAYATVTSSDTNMCPGPGRFTIGTCTWNVGGIDAGSIVGNANNGGKTWTVDWQSGLNDIKSGSGAGSLFVLSDPTASLYLTHNWWKQQKCCPNGSSGNLNKIWETGNANYALSGNFDYTAISVFPSWYQDIINYLGSLPGYSNQLATITGFGHFKAGTGASVNANTTIYTLMEDDCNGCSASYTTGDCQFNANMNDSATSTLFGGVNISITGSFSSDLRTYGVAVPPAPATQMNIYMQDYITYSLYSYAKIGSHGPGGYYWITPGSQHMPNPATVINTVCITPNL